jgi:hypothetical protein
MSIHLGSFGITYKSQSLRRGVMLATTALMLIATLVSVAVIFATPIIGWANNFDFIRSSGCTGLWTSINGLAVMAGHPTSPIPSLVKTEGVPNNCVPSSDLVFPYFLTVWVPKNGVVSIKWLGVLRLMSLVGPTLWLYFRTQSLFLRFSIVVTYGLVFDNIFVLGFFNSLYTDASVFISLWVTCIYLVGLIYSPKLRTAPNFVILFIATGWLALAKHQTMIIGILLLLCICCLSLVNLGKRAFLLLTAGTVLVVGMAFQFQNGNTYPAVQGLKTANSVDSLFAVMLPALSPQERVELGMPFFCRQFVGESWYSAPRSAAFSRCDAWSLANQSSVDLSFIANVSRDQQALDKTLQGSWSLRPSSIAVVSQAGQEGWIFKLASDISVLSKISELVTPTTWARLVGLALWPLGLVLAIVSYSLWKRSRLDNPRKWLLVATSCAVGLLTQIYFVTSSVIGDGYFDAARHTLPLIVGLALELEAFLTALLAAGTDVSLKFGSNHSGTKNTTGDIQLT